MTHPFDELTALEETAGEPPAHPQASASTAGGRAVVARTHPAWANMVGPYGGATAAQVLAAILSDDRAQGRPAALTINYTTAIADGEMRIVCDPVRTNRSNQHWTVRVEQESGVVLTGTALLATGRETFSDTEAALPASAGSPADHPPVAEGPPLRWLDNYEFRFAKGGRVSGPEDASESSETLVWYRSVPPRPWDYASLAAAADVFVPRVFLRTGTPSPAGTITFTVYFHADPEELGAQDEFLLGQAHASRFHGGLFDQAAHVWGASGDLLATTTQLVYFKQK